MLRKSEVVFDAEHHTYTLHGKELQGITPMLHSQLFPRQYAGVPPEVLRNAASRGTLIHSYCQMYDELEIAAEAPEVDKYIALKLGNGLRHVVSEYIVSDNEHFASAIDKVYTDKGGAYILGDIKTTYKLNEEYVRWQLSVYSFLFSLQNPGLKADRLCAIWLRGNEGRLVWLDPIPEGIIIDLLEAQVQGRAFVNPLAPAGSMPERYRGMEESIAEICRQAKYWADRKKELAEGVMKGMVSAGAYSWKGGTVSFTRKKDGIRKAFDEKAFKEEHPDLYAAYLRDTPVTGSVTIRVKDNPENGGSG